MPLQNTSYNFPFFNLTEETITPLLFVMLIKNKFAKGPTVSFCFLIADISEKTCCRLGISFS